MPRWRWRDEKLLIQINGFEGCPPRARARRSTWTTDNTRQGVPPAGAGETADTRASLPRLASKRGLTRAGRVAETCRLPIPVQWNHPARAAALLRQNGLGNMLVARAIVPPE